MLRDGRLNRERARCSVLQVPQNSKRVEEDPVAQRSPLHADADLVVVRQISGI